MSCSGYISLEELKVMMEGLGAPQTHLGLKAMIKEADEDGDGAISFRYTLCTDKNKDHIGPVRVYCTMERPILYMYVHLNYLYLNFAHERLYSANQFQYPRTWYLKNCISFSWSEEIIFIG